MVGRNPLKSGRYFNESNGWEAVEQRVSRNPLKSGRYFNEPIDSIFLLGSFNSVAIPLNRVGISIIKFLFL